MNLANTWKHLIKENPMMAEISRFRRRYFSFQGPMVAVNGGLGILLVAYAIFAYFCIHNRGDIEPIGLMHIFLVFALLAVPLLLHSTIAGERERRSWDMLLVAPLTHSQIIVGKFVGAFFGLLFAFGIFLIPVFIVSMYFEKANWLLLLCSCLIVICQISSVIALTILISSRVKRPLTALGVTLAVVIIYYLFAPTFIASLSGPFASSMVQALSPFGLIYMLSQETNSLGGLGNSSAIASMGVNVGSLVITNIIFEVVLTAALLGWAVKTLVYADNEVKFLPKAKRNA